MTFSVLLLVTTTATGLLDAAGNSPATINGGAIAINDVTDTKDDPSIQRVAYQRILQICGGFPEQHHLSD